MRRMTRANDFALPRPKTSLVRYTPYCLAILTAGISGLLYWIVAALIRPNASFPVTILYRFGDTDYLSLFYALSRFQFHEFVTQGIEPARLIGFPTGLSFLYALPIAVFGDSGFPVADLIISMLRMTACLLAARIFFRTPAAIAAAAIAVFVLTGPLPLLSDYWTLFYRPLWDMRYLRPFVTGLFALCLVINTHYFNEALYRPLPDWRLSIFQGALIGLTVQGDLHLAMIACFVTGTLYLYAIIRKPSRWNTLLASAGITATAIAVMLPLVIVQLINTNPDASRRLGWVTLSRTNPPLMWPDVPWQGILTLSVLFALIWWKQIGGDKLRNGRRMVGLSLLFAVMSVLSLPLSAIVLGRGIQVFHFPFRAFGFVILGFAFVGLILGWFAFHSLARLSSLRTATLVVGSAVAVLALIHGLFFGVRAADEVTKSAQQRPSLGALVPGYHSDLDALWRELSGPRYRNMHVAGTFDQQLGMLWLTRPSHWLWLPDPFLTTVSDSAIENRVISFCQLIGMSPTEFDRDLGDPYFVTYILNSFEWPQHSPPASERLRLDASYKIPHKIDGRLDLVVLVRSPGYGHFPEVRANFEKTFENATFTVWARPDEIDASEKKSSTPGRAFR